MDNLLIEFSWTVNINSEKDKLKEGRFMFSPFVYIKDGYRIGLLMWIRNSYNIYVGAYITKGEHDDILQWPFRKPFRIEAININDDKLCNNICIDSYDMNSIPNNCLNREYEYNTYSNVSAGYNIPLSDLSNHIKDGEIMIRFTLLDI